MQPEILSSVRKVVISSIALAGGRPFRTFPFINPKKAVGGALFPKADIAGLSPVKTARGYLSRTVILLPQRNSSYDPTSP